MKLKRLATFVATFAISVVGYSLINTVSASAATLGWTGAAGNNSLYSAGNWEPAQAPASGDILIFQSNAAIDTTPPQNAPTFNTIQFMEGVTVAFTKSAGPGIVASTVLLERNAIVTTSEIHIAEIGQSGVGFVAVGEGAELIVTERLSQSALEMIVGTSGGNGAGTLKFDRYLPSTSEQTISITEGTTLEFGAGKEGDFRPKYLNVEDGSTLNTNSAGIFGGTRTDVRDEGTLLLPQGIVVDKPIYFGDGTKIIAKKNSSNKDITLSGDVSIVNYADSNLNSKSQAIYTSGNDKINLMLTGNVTGGKIVPIEGSGGSVVVKPASGKSNDSATSNGETKPATKTTTITNTDMGFLSVFSNNIVIVNGQRGATTVYDGGILKGKGTVGALTIMQGGRVAPGESPGILNAGNTTFNAGSFFEAEIGGTTVGTEYDQLKVTGTVNLGGAALDTKLINDFKPKAGDTFTIIDNDGTDAITGTFNDLPEGATFTIDGTVFKISYTGGDGNDVVLSVQTVPGTPNTGMKLLSGNPLLTLGLTTLSAGALFVLARKYGDVWGR